MPGKSTEMSHGPGRRLQLGLAAAMLLPILTYQLITIGIGYRDDRIAIETATRERAMRITSEVDARLDAISGTVRALATIRSIKGRNWTEARLRSSEIAALDPDWRSVQLVDLSTGMKVMDLRTRPGQLSPPDWRAAVLAANASRSRPTFSDIVAGPTGPELHAYLAVGSGKNADYLLDVALDPLLVQRILVASAPKEGLSAVVDRHGLFIARTKAWRARLGTPGSVYLRRATENSGGGLYKGFTLEGMENYAAFTTSPRTGWSSHVAVSSSLIDNPQFGWRLASIGAAAAGLILSGLMVMFLLRMMAERRRVEIRQQHSERLEAVGKLTGGIAHDFNNMLGIVIGSLDLAQRRLAKGNTDVLRHVDNAIDGAHRAAELTRRLLAFSRNLPLAPTAIDVNALIEGMHQLLERTLSASIQIKTRLAADLWTTFVDPGQLENALVNLAVNARDAMPDGGTLEITTVNRPAKSDREVTDRIEISVRDTGIGMTPAVAARAFEPFYTTKEVGRGTGLGLSQIHGFALQSGGETALQSREGRGTTISIFLPRHHLVEGESGDMPLSKHDQTAPLGRPEEIILVVEDEEKLRRTNVEALRSLGYTVRHADSAEDALTLLDSQPGVKLLMTDIVMPGMNGRDLAKKVATWFPEIRILLVTGFEREQLPADESRILRKPFGVGELARRVRVELDSAA